ncbi:MAG: tetratricopeptide repeat protein [Microcystis aeruginosa BS13-02]|jgi:tetratricopeptide (TPR) repeat protein|nr:tetratricopeptide repeat protein [Microcystis aeruginosa BS13-02]
MEWNDIRFTLDAFKVIRAAQSQARELGHKYAGPEFLLLGLLQIMSESHTFILNQFPLDLDAIHLEIINVIGIGFNSPRKSYKPAFTLKAKNVIAKAVAKAHRDKLGFVSSIYLLWSLLQDTDNLGVKILESLNININLLRDKVQKELDKHKASIQSVSQLKLLPINQNLLLENTPKLSENSKDISHVQVPDYLKNKSPDEAEYIQAVLSCLEINPTELKSMKKTKRRRYRIILQFLTDNSDNTTIKTPFSLIARDEEDYEKVPNLKTIEHYLQIFSHLWEDLQEYDKAILFLFIPLKHINNFKLCKQLHEWGYYEEEKDIYESILSIKSGDESALDYSQYSITTLLLAKAYERTGQYKKAHESIRGLLFHYSSPPHLISEDELKLYRYFDIYDNTNYQNFYYHYFFKTRLVEASILASLGLLGEAADEYEKCFNKSQWLEETGVTQKFGYTSLANLEIKINALLGCGDCYFKIKDYDNAMKRYSYALHLHHDFMIDDENDDLILGNTNNHAILDSLFVPVTLGVAQTYRVYKLYSDAKIYYEMALSSLKVKNKYFFSRYSLKRKSLRIECLTGIGKIHYDQKQYQQAIPLFEEALKIVKELEDLQNEAIIYSQLANVYFYLKNHQIANEYYLLFERKICNRHLLGYDAVVIYSNWSKVLRKLRKYTKSKYAEYVSLHFKSSMKINLDALKMKRRVKFEARKRDFELNISNPMLRWLYGLWNQFENGLFLFCTYNGRDLKPLIDLLIILISIPFLVVLLPISIIVTIWEEMTESKD